MLSKCKVIVFKFQEKTLKGKMQVGEKASKHTWNIYIYCMGVCMRARTHADAHAHTHTLHFSRGRPERSCMFKNKHGDQSALTS